MKFFAVVLLFVTVSQLQLVTNAVDDQQQEEKPNWKDLLVTFRRFSSLPKTVQEAKDQGWTLTASCKDNNYFAGDRYILNGDIAVMLLFGVNGKVAGMQMGVPKSVGVKNSISTWVLEGDMYVLTVYFREPGTICKCPGIGDSFGDRLILLNGKDSTIEMPYKEDDLNGTTWVAGKCFPNMGQHYWYDISSDMSCDDFFPLFLMYHNNKLTAFGFTAYGDLKSPRLEHPTAATLQYFYKKETLPKCLQHAGQMNTMHVYLTRNIRSIQCRR